MKRKYLIIPLTILFSSLFMMSSCSNGEETYSSEQTDAVNVKNGVTYNFYYSKASTNQLYSITGKPGQPVPYIPVPKRTFYTFDCWEADDESQLLKVFGNQSLDFYAQWNSTTRIGNKIKPSVVGDIVFTDGSATSYADAIETPLTEEQKNQAVAVIYTTSYNPENGNNKNGNTMLAIAINPKNTKWCEETIKVNNDDVYLALYVGYDLQNITYKNQTAGLLSFNMYDGSKNLAKTDQLVAYSYYYAPAFYYAYTYGETVDMVESLRDGWYLPSYYEMRVLMIEEGLLSTIKSVFTLAGKTFDVNANTSKTTQSTLILTSFSDSSYPEGTKPGDHGGEYSKDDMWVSLRMYDITAEPKMRDKIAHVNPKESYEKASIYNRAYALDFKGEVNLVNKSKSEWEDGHTKSYAFPVRAFK
ncbi:hypothetical protein MSI_05670 [Treponema sp. JC4]|uniref:hypothetical protein n=1 Tax=Treponema sp. JC4 TaxID=1124982 RepID=UPI00025B0BD9|nr:hypothetical protein [Treponema sp. JC4]EID85748.1 hypothetical protein MSI_05670 [Treponema sp. JC4]